MMDYYCGLFDFANVAWNSYNYFFFIKTVFKYNKKSDFSFRGMNILHNVGPTLRKKKILDKYYYYYYYFKFPDTVAYYTAP